MNTIPSIIVVLIYIIIAVPYVALLLWVVRRFQR